MTYWIDSRDGRIELKDDDRVVAIYTNQHDADEVLGMHDLIERQGRLLSGVVIAIRGAPPEDTSWSHHDAPELARQAMTHLGKLAMFASLMKGMLPVCTDTARILIEDLDRFKQLAGAPIAERAP